MSKRKLFENPTHTIGELFNAACKVTTTEEAQQFLNEYVEYMRKYGTGEGATDPEGTAKANIGYVLGYGASREVVKMFNKLKAIHPVFGESYPGPDKAFEAGVKAAKANS